MTTDTPATDRPEMSSEAAASEVVIDVTPPGARTLRVFDDIEAARAAIIRRAPLTEPVLPEAVQRGIDEL